MHINFAVGYKIAFLQVYLQALLAVGDENVELLLRKNGIGQNFPHYGQQVAQVFAETVEGNVAGFVVAVAVEVAAIKIEVLVDVESTAAAGAIFQQKVGGTGYHVGRLVAVACQKHPLQLQHGFFAGMQGIYLHPVVEGPNVYRFQLK